MSVTEAPAAPSWPADRVEKWPITDLAPYQQNPRLHTAEQVDLIVASMRQFGWTMPVLVDEGGEIIAGHGRVLAAQRLGWSFVPVIVARGWSDDQKRAYRIADNQLTLAGSWDQAALAREMVDLEAAGFDLLLTGFSTVEIDRALGVAEQEAVLQTGLVEDDPYAGLVAFRFGDYVGRVSQAVYDRFDAHVKKARAGGAATLDEIMAAWLPE